jgi:hypothetical protein
VLCEDVSGGRWLATGAAFLLLIAACAPPNQQPAANFRSSPTPPPSPTPTDPLVAATPPSFHAGEVGLGYAPVALSATGGRAPYSWTVSSGALPGGLSLVGDGSISGTPTAAGTFAFTIQVADSGTSTAKIDGKISIAAALSASLIPACAQYCNVELGCVDACGTFGQLSGGVGPYSYALTQGPLPAGTSLVGLSLTGTFIGQSGWLQFAVQITDALGAVASVAPKFWMYPHIEFSGGAVPSSSSTPCFWTGAGPGNPGCTAIFPYSGGTPNAGGIAVTASWQTYTQTCVPTPTPPATCSVPPPMPTITAANGVVTVAEPTGGRTWSGGWSGTLIVVLTNQDRCAAGAYCSSTGAKLSITQWAS